MEGTLRGIGTIARPIGSVAAKHEMHCESVVVSLNTVAKVLYPTGETTRLAHPFQWRSESVAR